MISKSEFPPYINASIDIAVDNISRMPVELQDDAIAHIIAGVKKKAESKQKYEGLRLIADINEHIEREQEKHMYIIKRNGSNVHKFS